MIQTDLEGNKIIEESPKIRIESEKEKLWKDTHTCVTCGNIDKDLDNETFMCDNCIAYRESKNP